MSMKLQNGLWVPKEEPQLDEETQPSQEDSVAAAHLRQALTYLEQDYVEITDIQFALTDIFRALTFLDSEMADWMIEEEFYQVAHGFSRIMIPGEKKTSIEWSCQYLRKAIEKLEA